MSKLTAPNWHLASPVDSHWLATIPEQRVFACAVNTEGEFGYPWSVRVMGATASGASHTFEGAKRSAWNAVERMSRPSPSAADATHPEREAK